MSVQLFIEHFELGVLKSSNLHVYPNYGLPILFLDAFAGSPSFLRHV